MTHTIQINWWDYQFPHLILWYRTFKKITCFRILRYHIVPQKKGQSLQGHDLRHSSSYSPYLAQWLASRHGSVSAVREGGLCICPLPATEDNVGFMMIQVQFESYFQGQAAENFSESKSVRGWELPPPKTGSGFSSLCSHTTHTSREGALPPAWQPAGAQWCTRQSSELKDQGKQKRRGKAKERKQREREEESHVEAQRMHRAARKKLTGLLSSMENHSQKGRVAWPCLSAVPAVACSKMTSNDASFLSVSVTHSWHKILQENLQMGSWSSGSQEHILLCWRVSGILRMHLTPQ